MLEAFRHLLSGEREQKQGVVKVRLGRAGDGARELLPWTAGPGAQKNFDPEHPLARDSKGRSLALVLYLIVVVVCVYYKYKYCKWWTLGAPGRATGI